MSSLLLPGLIVVLVGVAAGFPRWRLRPEFAIRVLSLIAVVCASTVFVIVLLTSAGFAGRSALVMSAVEACPAIPLHHQVGSIEGSIAVAVLLVMVYRLVRVVVQHRAAIAGTEGQRIKVLDTSEPVAYAAPGDPGCVVVSNGLLGALSPRERQVLFAHERAHLQLNHHRFLLMGSLSVAVVPLLGPLAHKIRLATERSADEVAVGAMKGDRELVAVSIARAALATAAYPGSIGAISGGSIPIRVGALLEAPLDNRATRGALVAVFTAATVAVVASWWQAHQYVELIEHICNRPPYF